MDNKCITQIKKCHVAERKSEREKKSGLGERRSSQVWSAD